MESIGKDHPESMSNPPWRKIISGVAVVAVTLGGLLILNSCSSTPDQALVPTIEGAHFVGSKSCSDCHGNINQRFAESPHARIRWGEAKGGETIGCEACHGPASLHVAAPARSTHSNILNPAREVKICLNCHGKVADEFNMPHRHPLTPGSMSCSQCHDPHGRSIQKRSSRISSSHTEENCSNCHREQTRLRLFEHEALKEGCVTCHSPHGSRTRKMLTESDANLCLKCHAQNDGAGAGSEIFIGKVAHGAYLRQGTCWSAGCHTAVHGSNISPKLFY